MWMKVDDGLHAHRKTRTVTKSSAKNRDAAPMGLWVLAGSWAAQNGTDGWVPEDELDRWDDDWRALAARLVRAGYWWPSARDGEDGYGFNDWLDYNPESEAASKSGIFGNHVRWHANKGVVDPECTHCPKEPVHPDLEPESPPDRPPISPPESGQASGRIALPPPDPTRTRPDPTPSHAASLRDDAEPTAQSFVAEWLGACEQRPPGRVIGHVAREVKQMLDEGIEPARVRNGLIEWNRRGLHPSTLASVVHETSERRTRPNSRIQETNDIFERAAVRMGVIQGGHQ